MPKFRFGRLPDGADIDLYTLENSRGLSCKILNYGGILTEVMAPDRNGKLANIVLGYDRLEDYIADNSYKGAIIGRVANRIADASFTLDGILYPLIANDGQNHLHGGWRGFDKRVWHAIQDDPSSLFMSYTSAAGEEGYPGEVFVFATFNLNDQNELAVSLVASASAATPLNLTYHPYWNLAGLGNVFGHSLQIAANAYTPTDEAWIPTGKIEPVAGSCFDFRNPAQIGSRLDQLPWGYNVNYILNEKDRLEGWLRAARAKEPESGRALELWTNQPGLQFYSGGYLPEPGAGFCLEPQGFPDALHHPNFPSIILAPNRHYANLMRFRFFTE